MRGDHGSRRAAGACNQRDRVEQCGRAQAKAAIGFGDVQAHQPHFGEAVEMAGGRAAGLVDFGGCWTQHLDAVAADRFD